MSQRATMTELWGRRGRRFYPSVNRLHDGGFAAFVVDLRHDRVVGPVLGTTREAVVVTIGRAYVEIGLRPRT